MSLYLYLAIHSVIFAIFYSLIFLLLNKTSVFKINFSSIFFFTTIMYFVLSLLIGMFIKI